mgnify:CR=1 FL=1
MATVASAAAKQGDVAIQQEQAATERIGEENSIPTLEFVGSFAEEGGFVGDVFPLANCQGDCDLDEVRTVIVMNFFFF